jgi:DNA-directed RNA polymerase specialized sigma subunit, sigma24 homolog
VRSIAGTDVEAEDVVQEAFAMAWRDLPKLRDSAAFGPWFHRVVINATRNALRRRRDARRDVDLSGELMETIGGDPTRRVLLPAEISSIARCESSPWTSA